MSTTEEIAKKLRAFWADIHKLEWIPGIKHPLTPVRIFKNLWSYDQDRKKTKARCQICDHAISDDNRERHELIFACERGKCLCSEPFNFGLTAHTVCDVCDGMYRAIYINWGMKNRDYFKKLDEELRKLRGPEGRNRMGLD